MIKDYSDFIISNVFKKKNPNINILDLIEKDLNGTYTGDLESLIYDIIAYTFPKYIKHQNFNIEKFIVVELGRSALIEITGNTIPIAPSYHNIWVSVIPDKIKENENEFINYFVGIFEDIKKSIMKSVYDNILEITIKKWDKFESIDISKYKIIICYEPVNFKRLTENININKRIMQSYGTFTMKR